MDTVEIINCLAFVKCERKTNTTAKQYTIRGDVYDNLLLNIEKLANECMRLKEVKPKTIIRYRGKYNE